MVFQLGTSGLTTVSLGINALGNALDETITQAFKEGWKGKKGEACIKLAHGKFTVGAQVSKMLADKNALSPARKAEMIFTWARAIGSAP